MKFDNLFECSETLNVLVQNFLNLPDAPEKATIAALTLVQARIIIGELQKHLMAGMEPYDAVVATACGTWENTAENAEMVKRLSETSAVARGDIG